MIVIGCVLSGCAGNDNAEIVKESSKLQEINLTLYNGKSVNVTESEKVEDIVKVINGAAPTKKNLYRMYRMQSGMEELSLYRKRMKEPCITMKERVNTILKNRM